MKAQPKYSTHLAAALMASGLLLPLDVLAMRCGNHLISKGDTQAKVLKYCGDPVQMHQHLGLRSGVYLNRDRNMENNPATSLNYSRGHYINYGHREVVVEDWVFNFGPNKFMRRVTFEDGIVEKVVKLDYGYRDNPGTNSSGTNNSGN